MATGGWSTPCCPCPTRCVAIATSGHNGAIFEADCNVAHRTRSRPNGATQTFRRTSQTLSSSHQRESSTPTAGTGLYVPPHMNSQSSRNSSAAGGRYSKEQLLDIFRAQSDAGGLDQQLPNILTEGWTPGGSSATSNGWGRREDPKEGVASAEVCWDYDGMVQPLGLMNMTDEEKEVRRVWI